MDNKNKTSVSLNLWNCLRWVRLTLTDMTLPTSPMSPSSQIMECVLVIQ